MIRWTYAVAAVSATFAGCAQQSPTPAVVHEEPPPPPLDAGPPTGAGTSVFALRDVRFGDKDDAGDLDYAAWESLGFDIDGLVTTYWSNNVYQRVAGATTGSRSTASTASTIRSD
jgi:hypothetical protein